MMMMIESPAFVSATSMAYIAPDALSAALNEAFMLPTMWEDTDPFDRDGQSYGGNFRLAREHTVSALIETLSALNDRIAFATSRDDIDAIAADT